jgi:hypothetical protein
MRLLIALFVLALVAMATASVSVDAWDGRLGHHDMATRAIHYDSSYDLSAHRRFMPE